MAEANQFWRDAYEGLWAMRETALRTLMADEKDLSRLLSGLARLEKAYTLTGDRETGAFSWVANGGHVADPLAKLEKNIDGYSCGEPARLSCLRFHPARSKLHGEAGKAVHIQ